MLGFGTSQVTLSLAKNSFIGTLWGLWGRLQVSTVLLEACPIPERLDVWQAVLRIRTLLARFSTVSVYPRGHLRLLPLEETAT
jgi:hypothetical protein